MKPNIYSEIDKLKSVIVHRPGEELNNLTPDFMEELLFDELPYLENAIKEHDFSVKLCVMKVLKYCT